MDQNEVIIHNCNVASHGISMGKVFILPQDGPVVPKRIISYDEIEDQLNRLDVAMDKVKYNYTSLKERFLSETNTKYLADIIDAHIHILGDPQLKEKIRTEITDRPRNIEYIVFKIFEQFIKEFQKIDNPYFRERITDLKDVRDNLLDTLYHRKKISLKDMQEPAILIVSDLAPSDIAYFNPKKILGIVMEAGGVTSHASLIAKGMNIPTLVGVENLLSKVDEDDFVVLDAISGQLVVNPRNEVLKEYEEQQKAFSNLRIALAKLKEAESITTDGKVIRLFANCEIPEELEIIKSNGAKGIGLLRTEFIYYRYTKLPSEEEQYQAYYEVCKSMMPLPVTIRTLDLGGDKLLEEYYPERENNPFLGWRSLRFCLDNPDIFRSQLRAILRVSELGNVKIMFPLISGVDELNRALEFLDGIKSELDNEDIPYDKNVPVGIMMETPAAAVITSSLAKNIQFMSIGTNDLIQYTLAVDRGNEKIAYLYDPYHPSVLRMIKMILDGGVKNKRAVAMCGEMAGDPFFTKLLIGMGFEELSMIPSSIPEVKKIIRGLRYKHSRKIADTILLMDNAKEIRNYLRGHMLKRFPELSNWA